MPKVVLKENEVLDDALRRFKRQVSRNGTLAEARKREFYVKPGVRRKLKSEAAGSIENSIILYVNSNDIVTPNSFFAFIHIPLLSFCIEMNPLLYFKYLDIISGI